MSWLRGPRWKEQPPLGTRLDKSHPIGAALDSCWYRESLIDFERGVRAQPPATAGMNGSAYGVGWGRNTTAGAAVTFPQITFPQVAVGGPLLIVAFARLQATGSFLVMTGSGANASVSNASASITAAVRGNFGVTQNLSIAGLGTLAGTHQLVALQVFSPTDFRLYAAGQMTSGTTDCANNGSITLNAVAHPGSNQNCALFAGFGRGRALPDDYLMALTRDPQRLWEAFQPRALWFPVTAPGGGVTLAGSPLKSQPTVSPGAISQAHLLAGAALKSQPTASVGVISQAHLLAGAALKSQPTVSTGAAAQTHLLAGAAIKSQPAVSAGAIDVSGALTLVGLPLKSQPTVSTGVIAQRHVLLGAGLTQQPTVSAGAVTVPGALLVGTGLKSAPTVSAGAILQAHLLAGAVLKSQPVVSAGAIIGVEVDETYPLAGVVQAYPLAGVEQTYPLQ